MKLNRTNVSQTINNLPISLYLSNGGKNLRKTIRGMAYDTLPNDKRSEKVREENELLLKMKDGFDGVFARNGFELFDITPNLPLYKFFADGQVPTRFGGGFVEQVSAYRLNFDLPQARLTGTKTNERQAPNIKEQKLTVPAYAFQYLTTVTEFELMKFGHINVDIYGWHLEAMRQAYQLELEFFRFLGNEGIDGITKASPEFVGGLLNQPSTVAMNEYYGADWFTDFSVETFTSKILELINKIKVNTMGDVSKYPNMMLVGSDIWQALLQPAVVGAVGSANGTGVVVSIYEYLQRQISAVTGQPFLIQENFYLNKDANENSTTAGIVANGDNGSGMIVIYRYDEAVMRNHIPLPLTGGSMFPTASGYQQNHIAIATPTLVIYPTIGYLHNGVDPN